jgi:CRISPR/Cas system-associated endonuclease Cas1
MSIRLSELIQRIPPETKQHVDKARQRYNQMIRDALRKETAFVLNRQDVESFSDLIQTRLMLIRLRRAEPPITP